MNAENNATNVQDTEPPGESADVTGSGSSKPARRDIVRHGVKLAIVTPLISTFFVHEAQAVASAASCKPAASPCVLDAECCSNSCSGFNVCD